MSIDDLHMVDLLVVSYLKRRQCTQATNIFIKEAKLRSDATELAQPARGKHLEEIVSDFLKFGEPLNAAGHIQFANKFFALAEEYTAFRQQQEAASSSTSTAPTDFYHEAVALPANKNIEQPPIGRKKSRKLPIHKNKKLQNLTFREARNVPPVTVNPPPIQVNEQGMVDLYRNNALTPIASTRVIPPASVITPSMMYQLANGSDLHSEPNTDHLDKSKDSGKKQNRRFIKNPVKQDDKLSQSTLFLSTKIANLANKKITNPEQEDIFNFELVEDLLDELSLMEMMDRPYRYEVPEDQPETSQFEYNYSGSPQNPSPVEESEPNHFQPQVGATGTSQSSQDGQNKVILEALNFPVCIQQQELTQSVPIPLIMNHEPIQSSSTVKRRTAEEKPMLKEPKTEISPKKEVETPIEVENHPIVNQKEPKSEEPENIIVPSRKFIKAANMFKPKKRKIDMSNAYAVLDQIHSNKL